MVWSRLLKRLLVHSQSGVGEAQSDPHPDVLGIELERLEIFADLKLGLLLAEEDIADFVVGLSGDGRDPLPWPPGRP